MVARVVIPGAVSPSTPSTTTVEKSGKQNNPSNKLRRHHLLIAVSFSILLSSVNYLELLFVQIGGANKGNKVLTLQDETRSVLLAVLGSHVSNKTTASVLRQNSSSEVDAATATASGVQKTTITTVSSHQHDDDTNNTQQQPASVAEANITNLWDNSKTLPKWMKEYFTWHYKIRQKLNETNWHQYKYMVIRCVDNDGICAGTADRLHMVPVHVLMACQSKRLLLYRWTRPAPLEEFLVPPVNGFDWRFPTWLVDKLDADKARPVHRLGSPERRTWYNSTEILVRVNKVLFAREYYEEHRTDQESHFWDIYHDLWKTMFIPSPPVQQIIDETLHEWGLGLELHNQGHHQYVAAHVRSLYAKNETNRHEEVNAIQCAAQLANNDTTPIFFASDSIEITRRAMLFGREKALEVLVRNNMTKQPLHLDRGDSFLSRSNDWKGRPPSDFYDTFVDLYLLAGSKCVSYGRGSFGYLASLISANHGCKISHLKSRCQKSPK